MNTAQIILAGAVLVLACVLVFALVVLNNLLSRYEKFRNENAAMFDHVLDNLEDMNRRLSAAGFPPGDVRPASSYPNWARREPEVMLPDSGRLTGRGRLPV
jgi:hypothetical protein